MFLLLLLLVFLATLVLGMSAHRIPYDMSKADWVEFPDLGTGNTSVGSGVLANAVEGNLRLISTANAQEERTLNDPNRAGLFLTVTYFRRANAQSLRINTATKVNTSGNTHVLFTALDQTVQFQSVPIDNAATAGKTGFRWEIVFNDGTSLS